MSQHNEPMDPLAKVVLVVPLQHVKTVKSALERCGQLDRTSKITPQTDETGQSKSADHDSSTRESSSTTEFPALEFHPGTGEYQDPADVYQASSFRFDQASGQHKASTTPSRFPKLQFDSDSGEYRKPADLRTFPRLQFDEVTGEYKSPADPEDPQALEFDAAGGLDLKSGECRSKTEPQVVCPDEDAAEQRMRIPTTIPYESPEHRENGQRGAAILDTLGLSSLLQSITFSHSTATTSTPTEKSNPLRHTLQSTLRDLQHSLLDPLNLDPSSLLSCFPDSYTVYHPMLLLSHTTFSSPPWQTLLSAHSPDSPTLHPLWKNLAKAVNATHIAINSPIPPQTQPCTSSSKSPSSTTTTTAKHKDNNILRIPLNLTPLFGNFGPTPTPRSLSTPTASDFAQAFWVHTTQHGIHQTWAPLYTMFSRGNIMEKARVAALAKEDVLSSSSSSSSPSSSSSSVAEAAAADFYAGIGYFAFSYRKAGVKPVVCWELNPWSVEGLRRGARLNRWTVHVCSGDDDEAGETQSRADLASGKTADLDFIVFPMSNASALAVLPRLREVGARIRRVNLGLLPSSEESWGTAVRVLLRSRHASCCWIHAHENVAVGDIERRAGEVELEFQKLVELWGGERESAQMARVQHVERVKMYAPGVAHCVFDVYIQG